MSALQRLQLGVGLGQGIRAACALFLGGHLVEHRQVVEALAQILDPAQLALGVRQLAGDLLGVRSGRPTASDRRPRARASRCGRAAPRYRAPAPPWSGWCRGRRCRLTVGIHGCSGYRRRGHVGTGGGFGQPGQVPVQHRDRGRARTGGSKMRPYYVAIVGSGPSGYFAAASLLKFADASVAERRRRRARRHAGDAADAVGPGAVRSGAGPPEDQVDQRAVREDVALIRGSGSSATSRSASTCRPPSWPSATTRWSTPSARSPIGRWAFPARNCPAASPPSTSSVGTTLTRTSRRWHPTSPAAARSSSATATSRSTSPASW